MNKKKFVYLIITSLITVASLYISDQILAVSYMSKVFLKVILFATFPVIYRIGTGENILRLSYVNFFKRAHPKRQRINISIVLGIAIFVVLWIVQLYLLPYIDTSQLVYEFEEKYKINQGNIVYYSIYLVFLNSFLEEFFFRGYIFLGMKRLGYRKSAYVISATLFAVYHIANFKNWLNIGVFILAILGLIVGGCIFNAMDDRQETFLNSWFVHICADVAIVLTGFRVFGIM